MIATKRKLIVIGGRGNGTVLAAALEDVIAAGSSWEFLGFSNDSHGEGDVLDGYPTLGKPEHVVQQYIKFRDCYFIFALIGSKVTIPRVARLRELMKLGLSSEKFATIVHPSAVVSKGVELGNGIFVSPHVYIGPYARIDDHVYIHANSYVARNSVLRKYSYLAPQAVVGAGVVLECGAYLGTSSCTIENIVVGAWSVVGIGSTTLKPVEAYSIVVGNPATAIGTVPYRWLDYSQGHYEEVVQ